MGEARPELYSASPFHLPFRNEQLNEYDCGTWLARAVEKRLREEVIKLKV
jgi:hypothetical protein